MQVSIPWSLDVGAVRPPLGYLLVVDDEDPDPIGRELTAGSWSPSPALLWLLGVIAPGDRVLDLGAHIGTFAMAAAAAGAAVTAVEPSPRNAALLEAAADANGFTGVSVLRRAVDATMGLLPLVDYGPFSTIETAGIGSTTGYPVVEVQAVTVDQIAGEGFDWAKIDVEGAEDRALSAARQSLRGLKGLVIECNGPMLLEHGASPIGLVRRLTAAGFRLFRAVSSGRRRLLRPIGMQFYQPEATVDYVAVRGRPPLPRGWSTGRRLSSAELATALAAELHHPVPEHQAYAEKALAEAPLAVQFHLGLRSSRDGRGSRHR